MATSLAIISAVRKEGFESIAQAADRVRFLQAVASEVRVRVDMGVLDATALDSTHELAEAHRAFEQLLVSGRTGLSVFEQQCVSDWAGRIDINLSDRPGIELVRLLSPPEDGQARPGPRSTSGGQLADIVDELRVWHRLVTEELDWPYAVRLKSGQRLSSATSRGSELECRQWLREVAAELHPTQRVDAAIYRADPATGEQRSCLRLEAVPAAEFRTYLDLLEQAEAQPTPTGDRDDDQLQVIRMMRDLQTVTRQLNDPRNSASAFEALVERENLRHQIRAYTAAAVLPSIEQRLDAIDLAQRPHHEQHTDPAYFQHRLDRLADTVADIRAAGRVDITPPDCADRRLTAGSWSDNEPGPWFVTTWGPDIADQPGSTHYFSSVRELLAHTPVTAAQANELAALDRRIARAQSLVDAARMHRDSVRHSTALTAASALPAPHTAARHSVGPASGLDSSRAPWSSPASPAAEAKEEKRRPIRPVPVVRPPAPRRIT
ncbi:hypothetical protein ACTD5D_20465 [Nocardia takedensis]|uniref:hypothetical protein n=1 Tax=Nocardia takedensis TaxID=259390 RepID=UPI003F775FE9